MKYFTCRVEPGKAAHKEPKFIVFFSMLMNLFSMFCFKCKQGKPTVTMKSTGTMVTVYQNCFKCGEHAHKWRSQPLVLGRYPAGNLLLSFGVLMAGASISKVLLVFRHMGLSAYKVRTFFAHQKTFLFPAILHYWESYRATLLNTIKGMKDVIWCGDGRFDSMGHSAKYGAYTMFCSSILKVVHFEILQVCGFNCNFSVVESQSIKKYMITYFNKTTGNDVMYVKDTLSSALLHDFNKITIGF